MLTFNLIILDLSVPLFLIPISRENKLLNPFSPTKLIKIELSARSFVKKIVKFSKKDGEFINFIIIVLFFLYLYIRNEFFTFYLLYFVFICIDNFDFHFFFSVCFHQNLTFLKIQCCQPFYVPINSKSITFVFYLTKFLNSVLSLSTAYCCL